VEAILLLEQNLKASRQQVRQLESQLFKDAALRSYAVETSLEVQELRETCNCMADNIRKKRAALGVGQRTALSRIQENEFLQVRVNTLALKKRIRDRLRQRKFEREPLERSYRHAKKGKVVQVGFVGICS
jgi:flagellar motility protein MotE (MotC chaperone)